MINTIIRNLKYEDNKEYKSPSSRYNVCRVISEVDGRYLETYNDVKIKESSDDIYHVVTMQEEGRLDIISNNYYSTPNYWWAIALANNIIDPFSIVSGNLLRIPSLMSISDPYNEVFQLRGR